MRIEIKIMELKSTESKDINESTDIKDDNTSTIISLASSIIMGLIGIIIGFGVWYLWLRPEDEVFPFPNSRLEVLWIIVIMGIIGFWLGPKFNNLISVSKYEFTILHIISGLLIFASGIGVG